MMNKSLMVIGKKRIHICRKSKQSKDACAQGRTAEIVMMAEAEDVERICEGNYRRRAVRECQAKAQAKAQIRAQELRRQRMICKAAGAVTAAIMMGLGIASGLEAGWWAAIAPTLLAAIALEVTGW